MKKEERQRGDRELMNTRICCCVCVQVPHSIAARRSVSAGNARKGQNATKRYAARPRASTRAPRQNIRSCNVAVKITAGGNAQTRRQPAGRGCWQARGYSRFGACGSRIIYSAGNKTQNGRWYGSKTVVKIPRTYKRRFASFARRSGSI